jgi:hypothetical protein
MHIGRGRRRLRLRRRRPSVRAACSAIFSHRSLLHNVRPAPCYPRPVPFSSAGAAAASASRMGNGPSAAGGDAVDAGPAVGSYEGVYLGSIPVANDSGNSVRQQQRRHQKKKKKNEEKKEGKRGERGKTKMK